MLKKTWYDANKYCKNKFGTKLASITSSNENSLAFNLCGNNKCWIGINDINSEGIFYWIDGTNIIYTNWISGEPNNFNGIENCGIIDKYFYGKWNDVKCYNLYYFLCNSPNSLLFNEIQNNILINEFRTFDGTNNNLYNDLFGIHNGPIIRQAPGAFGEGGIPARENQKSCRIISNIVSKSNEADTSISDVGLSNLAWVFGQFIDHELVEQTASMENLPETSLDETEICIPIPENDPFFIDPNQICILFIDNAEFDANDEVPRLINSATSFIDGSAIYGAEPERINFLKNNNGKMNTSINENGDINLPFNIFGITNAGGNNRNDLFIAGDVRVNENIALSSIHTIWIREHNRLINLIKNSNPLLNNNELFEFARLVNTAQLQHIIFNEWLPTIFGEYNFNKYFNINTQYNNTCDASIAAHFSFVTFRLGHTLISDELSLRDSLCNINGETGINLLNAFTQPNIIKNGNSIVDRMLNGLSCTSSRNIDTFIIQELRDLLQFNVNNNTNPMDLMSINICRARDDGITDYVTLRSFFNLIKPINFNDINNLFLNIDIKNRIQTAYNNNINFIDPIIGAFGEKHINGGAIGELIAESLSEQFQRLIDCDRFFYKRYISGNLLKYVESQTMRNIIKLNTNNLIEFRSDHQFIFNIPGKGLNKKINFIYITTNLEGLCLETFHAINTNNHLIFIQYCQYYYINSNQLWYYNIKSKEIINKEGKCLTIDEKDFKNKIINAKVLLFDCTGHVNQKWFIYNNDINGHITNLLGQCLEIPLLNVLIPGTLLRTSQCILPGQLNQNWQYLGDKLPQLY